MKERSDVTSLCLTNTVSLILSSKLMCCFPLCVSQAVEELLAELDLDKRSIVLGASRVRTYELLLIKQPNMNPADAPHGSSSCCVSGVHEARCAALPGAAEGPAGDRLVGLSTGLLHGTSGPSEISQAQGQCLSERLSAVTVEL